MQPKSISPRALTASYCIALTIIAGLSILSHIVLDEHLRNNRGSAAIINISGRQRMLSQRISGLAAQYRLGDASARRDMLPAIAAFETAHEFLIAASRAPPASDASSQELRLLYFGTPDALDAQMRSFIGDARRVVDLPANDPAVPAILGRLFAASRSKLLVQLENIVRIQQAASEHKLAVLMRLQWGIRQWCCRRCWSRRWRFFGP